MEAEVVETGTEPVAVAKAREPSFLRPSGSVREANGSLACGIAACLVVLWAYYVNWPSLTGPSWNILNLLQSPVYFFVYLLALAAEVLSHAVFKDESRALFLMKQGLAPPDWLDDNRVSRARAGRYLGRIAMSLAVLLAILLVSSFSHFLRGRAS